MSSRRPLRFVLLPLVVTLAIGCGDSPTEPKPVKVPNFVRLQSDPGDYIGAGRSYEYTAANAVITVTATGNRLSVRVDGDEGWGGEFEGPATSTRVEKGTYSGLTRWPFHDDAKGGLDWSGEARGCNTLTGTFTVDSVTYVADALTAVDVRFEQHCEGATPALRGTIHWRADDTTKPAGPVNPPPTGLWQPPAGATPSSGNYVYLQSDAGDYIGQGLTNLYTPANATITVTSSGGHITVGVAGWVGEFQAMNSIPRIQAGYYPGLQRWPFHNPGKGGMDWSGQGRGCTTLTGWFVVDHVAYTGNALTAIDLRFEQHCEGGTPALRGAIRWRA